MRIDCPNECILNSRKFFFRFDIKKLRNMSKIFAHLLFTDAISWSVLSVIKLNENDTNSSARIFIKLLFQVRFDFSSSS